MEEGEAGGGGGGECREVGGGGGGTIPNVKPITTGMILH